MAQYFEVHPENPQQNKKVTEKATTMPLEPVNYMMIALGGLVIASSR